MSHTVVGTSSVHGILGPIPIPMPAGIQAGDIGIALAVRHIIPGNGSVRTVAERPLRWIDIGTASGFPGGARAVYKVLEGTETNVTFPNPSGTNPPSTGVLVVVRGPNVRAQIALPKVLAAGTAMETNTVNASGPGLWLGLFGHSEGAHDHTPGGGATQLVERIGVTHTGASIQALEVLAGQTPAHVASLSGSVGSVGFGVFFGPSAWSIGFIGLR